MSSRNQTGTVSSSGRSSRGRGTQMQDFTMSPSSIMRYFEPCAATASMFLYAQGSSIVCAHHDTLTIERRFSRHSDEVQLLAVDNHSEAGAGRLVVSYDSGQTAIVWDLMTGDEVARFASYGHLTTAVWMRNGNVAFGNTQGNIILFEPQNSEHLSARTIDQIAVTALAPAADCRTFAIGYQNGSLLIATLQPRFTILHNLTTSRAPSPIVTLHWHASSSRQKSDMLAVQTHDGDMRVWSVAKSHNSEDPAKVVRILKRTENQMTGPNWMSWSKNGRIIQYADSQTQSWDVRTKHVTYDNIPTLEHVKGLAVYGPGATLFTLGANNTVQQFDLNAPSIMLANVQHPANLLPPSPPVSIEEQAEKSAQGVVASGTDSEDTTGTIEMQISESDDDHLSPLARMVRQRAPDVPVTPADRFDSSSQPSTQGGLSDVSRSTGGSRTPGRYPSSVLSKGQTENTYISGGSSLRSSQAPAYRDRDLYSAGSVSGTSMSSTRPRRRGSRLRNEVVRSPEESKVADLFKFTRSRLSDIPYKLPPPTDGMHLTNDDLRRQMLSTIFGWHKEMEDLVRDEMSRHPQRSANRILLSKWLGEFDTDILAATSESMTSSDWMLLALNGITGGGDQAAQQKMGRAYVQRLLANGDIHHAVTILIGMGDHNDAIEIYVSHKRYMEALILMCLFFPSVWERQEVLVKKWGEWAVKHGQQQLAVRCFACTDQESTEPWTSPSAAQVTFQSMNNTVNSTIPEILSPPLSPPDMTHGPQRSVAKSSALKLITTFGEQKGQKSKFFSQGDDGQTPIAAGVTPIADSAVSPGGFDVTTAFIRPSNRSQFNTPNSARTGTSAFSRKRLPSIGEATSDIPREPGSTGMSSPYGESSRRGGSTRMSSADQEVLAAGLSVQRAATASPMMMRDQKKAALREKLRDIPPSPDALVTVKMESNRNRRNGSRDRIPDGVQLQLQPTANQDDITSPEQSVASSNRFHWPSRRRGPGSVSSVTSQSTNGRSLRSGAAGGRQEFIHSLDAATYKKQHSRHNSREGRKSSRSRDRDGHRSVKHTSRERSGERGRSASRQWTKPKRSPTSPVPMSPEDLINLSTPQTFNGQNHSFEDPVTVRKSSKPRQKGGSRTSSRGSKSRRASPEVKTRSRPPALDTRGRSGTREGSAVRSPSSPVPMSASALHYQGSEDEEDLKKAIKAQENFRNRHNRSTSSINPGEPTSPESKGQRRERSTSRHRRPREDIAPAMPSEPLPSDEHAGDLRAMKDERQRKKDQAARELEERRKSLAKRPSAPPIPHPSEFSPGLDQIAEAPAALQTDSTPRSQSGETRTMYASRKNVPIGLPATPKAMRLIMESDGKTSLPEVPPIPTTFAQRHSPTVSPQQHSPEKPLGGDGRSGDGGLATLLPSTVYQPPSNPILRSMSAPIPDEPAPRRSSHHKRSSHSRGQSMTKGSGDMRGNDTMLGGAQYGGMRRPSHDDNVPPPPPPPPMLKELQHLASPPPPPPAPLPHLARSGSGAVGNDMIEIVDDEEQQNNSNAAAIAAPMDTTVPVLAAPAPPSGKGHSKGHSRGRSFTERDREREGRESKDSKEGGFANRISKATERFRNRSASRNRREPSRLRSPQADPNGPVAPYESILPPTSYDAPAMRGTAYDSAQRPPAPGYGQGQESNKHAMSVQEAHVLPTGLQENELI